jgi:hypothetical protein
MEGIQIFFCCFFFKKIKYCAMAEWAVAATVSCLRQLESLDEAELQLAAERLPEGDFLARLRAQLDRLEGGTSNAQLPQRKRRCWDSVEAPETKCSRPFEERYVLLIRNACDGLEAVRTNPERLVQAIQRPESFSLQAATNFDTVVPRIIPMMRRFLCGLAVARLRKHYLSLRNSLQKGAARKSWKETVLEGGMAFSTAAKFLAYFEFVSQPARRGLLLANLSHEWVYESASNRSMLSARMDQGVDTELWSQCGAMIDEVLDLAGIDLKI